MKMTKSVSALILALLFTSAYALETENEKSGTTKQELKREVNKAGHRVEETVCMDSDAECLKQKVKHRTEEATETVKDKASEIRNKADE
jgi:hypothetical protein